MSSGRRVKGLVRPAARRARTRPLDAAGAIPRLQAGGSKDAKRSAGCTADDRGRLAPFPLAGRAGGWGGCSSYSSRTRFTTCRIIRCALSRTRPAQSRH
ncbi:hypothetical protein C6P97_02890 [Burkholderia multivorans]|uniref:Uncharacterized protein n=1 Tax=Burkholderia multivorans TaxID=87883 RepID=A0AB37AMH2_9BURK|nr:hypothetical protein C6P99_22500 [Burkholderia multivorans]PRE54667.1 hypothetical protein C6P97_02890 [Burkholderia multivorans]